LQLSNNDCDDVNTILKGAQQLVLYVHKEESELSRKNIGNISIIVLYSFSLIYLFPLKCTGLLLRQIKTHWLTALLLAFIREVEPFNSPLANPVHHSTNKENTTKQVREPEVECTSLLPHFYLSPSSFLSLCYTFSHYNSTRKCQAITCQI
jgi:hypothetical protein